MSKTHYIKPSKEEAQKVQSVLEKFYFGKKDYNIQKNTIGYVNKTFLVSFSEKKYILRESHRATSLPHLKLEAKVLDYLKKKSFKIIPFIRPNAKGQEVTIYQDNYYILQNFVPGKILASWNNPSKLSLSRLQQYFATSAHFTKTVEAFPTQPQFSKKGINYYVKNAKNNLNKIIKGLKNTPAHTFLTDHHKFLNSFIGVTYSELKKIKYDKLPKQLVHFDLHPGNFHFKNGRVVGLFDFDWVRYDNRISDLASTIGQSCYEDSGKDMGRYKRDRIKKGLQAYYKAYGKSEFSSPQEKLILIPALKGYMIFQFLWVLNWYKEHFSEKDALYSVKLFFNILNKNDYEKLFS
jgi:Ser/Thr protein kinase RdoA (MazF antagonist)